MEKTPDEAWRKIVVEAMRSALIGNRRALDHIRIEILVKAGFSLADIRDHWDYLQRRITK